MVFDACSREGKQATPVVDFSPRVQMVSFHGRELMFLRVSGLEGRVARARFCRLFDYATPFFLTGMLSR